LITAGERVGLFNNRCLSLALAWVLVQMRNPVHPA